MLNISILSLPLPPPPSSLLSLLLQYPYHLIIAYSLVAYLGYQDYKRHEVSLLPLLLLAVVGIGHLIIALPNLQLNNTYIAVFGFFLLLLVAMFILAARYNILIMTLTDYAVMLFMLFVLIDALPVFIFQMIFTVLVFSLLHKHLSIQLDKRKATPFITIFAITIPVNLLFIHIASFIINIG